MRPLFTMRRLPITLMLLVSCGGEPAVDTPARPTPSPGPAVTPAVAKPEPRTVSVPGMRFDRRGKPLGFGRRYVIDGLTALAYCPGDKELVAIGDETLYWMSAEHGGVLREVVLKGARSTRVVDCRADGAALVVADDAAVVVERNGPPKSSPSSPSVGDARFASDGSVRLIRGTKYAKWSGGDVEDLFDVGSPAHVVDGGALVHVHDGFLWIKTESKETKVDRYADESGKRGVSDLRDPTLASDGTLAAIVSGAMDNGAVAWIRGKRTVLSGTLGANAVHANPRWLVFLNGDSVWTQDRPNMDYAHADQVCGRQRWMSQTNFAERPVALSRDNKRIAIGCGGITGIRILDLDTLRPIAGRDPQPLVAAAWNGDRLATRDVEGTIQIWRDGVSIKTFRTGYDGDTLYWWKDELIADSGMSAFEHFKWSPVTGRRGKKVEQAVARSAHAKELTLHASWYPEGFLIQRGETLTRVAYDKHKTIHRLAVSPDGKHGLALRKFGANTISAPEGLEPDLAMLDLVALSSRIVPIASDAIAMTDTEITVAVKRELSHLVDDKLVKFATASSDISALAYSPDGRVLAVGLANGELEMFAGADRVASLAAHAGAVQQLIWDAPQLLSIADDQTLVWTFTP